MSAKGEPVFHIYLLFILCCFAYGGWSIYKYIEYLEDTINLQKEAIDKQNQENQILKNYIQTLHMYNNPTHTPPRTAIPQRIYY